MVPPVPKRSRWKRRLAVLSLLLFVPVLVFGIWNYLNYSRASEKIFGSSNILGALLPTPLKGEGRGRVNVLVAGYSADDPEHAGATLTDSIMIISLSTEGKGGYMLSVPRDLYVSYPKGSRGKINEAYYRGETAKFRESGYPAGGMGLLAKTVTQNLSIPIDYYALVNYAAVRDTTDALGGITVTIESTDPRGIYDPNFQPQEGGPLRLPNGTQSIDGQTALRLTRARGAAGGYGLAQSDFDRTRNQQAVVIGIKNAVTLKQLLDPRKNEPLLDAVADNVRTDIAVSEVLPLFRLFRNVPTEQLKPVSLRNFNGQNLLIGYTTPTGQAALVPAAGMNDYSDIRQAIKSLDQ